MLRFSALLLACAVLSSSQVLAATPAALEKIRALQSGDAKALQRAIDAGRQTASFCANCHGEDGNSNIPEVPNLSGQNPAYQLEQMRKFEAGERRDPFMQGLIKVLKEDERVNIVLYYSAARPQPGTANPALAARGKEKFKAQCVGCHGETARGNETIPRIAGQKSTYLITSLTRYRAQSKERSDPQMSAIAAALSKEEIAALAAYLASMP
jgi:cytochrome c553